MQVDSIQSLVIKSAGAVEGQLTLKMLFHWLCCKRNIIFDILAGLLVVSVWLTSDSTLFDWSMKKDENAAGEIKIKMEHKWKQEVGGGDNQIKN